MKIFKLLILLLLIQKGSAQNKTLNIPNDPSIKIGKLANGFSYYIKKNTEPKNRAELRLVVNAGSILETDKQVGVAHFVEHMGFNGTDHFKKQELINFLEKSGVSFGADLNASTSFDETIYELQVPTDSVAVFQNAIQILEDWAHGVSFEPTEIDKERGVIVEEWRLGRGAEARLRDKYFPVLLKGSAYAKRLPIGTKLNIDTVHHATITDFYKQWYRPDLEAIIIVGDVDVVETEKLIQAHFAHIPMPLHPAKRLKYGIPSHDDTRVAILTDPEQPYNVVQVYYTQEQLPPIQQESQLRSAMCRELFNQMMSSRLDEIAQQPEAPYLFASSSYSGFIGDKDAFSLMAVAKTGKNIEKSIRTILRENERVKLFGFVSTELIRAKKNILARVENEYRERDKTRSAELLQPMIDHFLKGETLLSAEYAYQKYQQWLPAITLEEINPLINYWIKKTNQSVMITAPAKEKIHLPTKSQLLTDLQKPFVGLKKYYDKMVAGNLLPIEPIAGKILAVKDYPAIDTKELTLSNGARVILKPTDFKNDDIQFSAISWGGSSQYADSDYLHISNAASIVSISGMGNMDMQSVQKFLAGKNCYAAPGINSYMQGINGSSTKKDLETAFQLMYGYFTFPRFDSSLLSVMKQQMRAQLINKDKDPNALFSDSISYIMGGYHFRRKPLTLQDVEKINGQRALQLFKDRFKNAGQFLFTIVGNFEIDSIRPLIEKYIASLPFDQQEDHWKDVGIRYPGGQLNKVIHKGKENKAAVHLYFTGNTAYDELEELQLVQLCKAMSIKLRELLREDAGGVYGISVNGGINREPICTFSIGIQFGCAPENVEKLIKMVKDEINNTRLNGIDSVNLEKTVAEQTRALENDIKDNGYWRYHLEQAFFRHADPSKILNMHQLIKKLTVKKSADLANKYFNTSNIDTFILLPDSKHTSIK